MRSSKAFAHCRTIPAHPDVLRVARRVVWFMDPKDAIADTELFLAHLMTFGMPNDILTMRRFLTVDDYRHALEHAPPGVFDPRSWAYWNLMTGRDPETPMPVRQVPGVENTYIPFPPRG